MEVILKAMAKKITRLEAAEIIGVCDAGTVSGVRLWRIVRPTAPEADHATSADGDSRGCFSAVSGHVL